MPSNISAEQGIVETNSLPALLLTNIITYNYCSYPLISTLPKNTEIKTSYGSENEKISCYFFLHSGGCAHPHTQRDDEWFGEHESSQGSRGSSGDAKEASVSRAMAAS